MPLASSGWGWSASESGSTASGAFPLAELGLGDQPGPMLGDGIKAQKRNVDDTGRWPCASEQARRRLSNVAYECPADVRGGGVPCVAWKSSQCRFPVRRGISLPTIASNLLPAKTRPSAILQLFARTIIEHIIGRQRIAVFIESEKVRQCPDDPVLPVERIANDRRHGDSSRTCNNCRQARERPGSAASADGCIQL